MQKAIETITISTTGFSIISKPNMGRLVKNKGSKAQCMAQANEVLIPSVSQFTLKFIEEDKTKSLQQSCKIINAFYNYVNIH